MRPETLPTWLRFEMVVTDDASYLLDEGQTAKLLAALDEDALSIEPPI